MKYLILRSVLIFTILFGVGDFSKGTAKFFALKNMLGENEIKSVAYLSYYHSLFAGYLIENNRMKILVGKYNAYDSSLAWTKSILIDSLVNVVGIAKKSQSPGDTTFLLSFNSYDTATHKNKIGALLINSAGTINWMKYYKRDTMDVVANWQGNSKIVGKTLYAGQTKALSFSIGSSGQTTNPVEIVINNSPFQEFEFADRHEESYDDPGCYGTGSNFMTGSYLNGAFGKDWFLLDEAGIITTSQEPGNQDNAMATKGVHQNCPGGGGFDNTQVYYRTDSNKIHHAFRNNVGDWDFNYVVNTFPRRIRINCLINTQDNDQVFVYSTMDSTFKVHYNVNGSFFANGGRVALPFTDLQYNAMQGYISVTGEEKNTAGFIRNANTVYKTSFIGSGSIYPYGPGCINENAVPFTFGNSSYPVTKPFVSTTVIIDTVSSLYSTANLSPYLLSFCVPQPVIQNGLNFVNPVCGGADVKVKISNPHPGNTISGTLNGAPLLFNWADSTFNLTGLLSAPSDTLQVQYQGVVLTATKDTVFNVTPYTAISLNSQPAPPVVCSGQVVTLTASGGNNFSWSGGIQNGVQFVPAVTTIFTVSSIDAYGCVNSASQTVTVNPVPNISITVQPANGIVCAGNNATLTASGGNTYTWSGGIQNGVAFTPTFTNIYTVTATTGVCSATATQTIIVSNCGLCQNSVIINTNPYNLALTESLNWILTSGVVVIPTGFTVKLDADTSGHVLLNPGFRTTPGCVFIAQAYNGCSNGAPSLPAMKQPLDDPSVLGSEEFLIYPNPSDGIATLRHPIRLKEFDLYDSQGKHIKNVKTSGSTDTKIDISTCSRGKYILRAKGCIPLRLTLDH